jgi:hypothetical protein
MKKYKKINVLTRDDLNWPFHGKPSFTVRGVYTNFPQNLEIDPFPCATHDLKLFKECVEFVESRFKLPIPVKYFILPFEMTCRTNGTAFAQYVHDQEIKKTIPIEKIIAFSGKRTIVLPAMTRYLVAHEYGHAVDSWINNRMLVEDDMDVYEIDYFRKWYAKRRGVKYNTKYGGGNWVDSIGEIIADDFRIFVAESTPDFYPHSCKHPLDSPDVVEIWDELINKYSI